MPDSKAPCRYWAYGEGLLSYLGERESIETKKGCPDFAFPFCVDMQSIEVNALWTLIMASFIFTERADKLLKKKKNPLTFLHLLYVVITKVATFRNSVGN